MTSYRPFIDDDNHIGLVEGERYVVLRPTDTVPDIYDRIRSRFEQRLAGRPVSFPAQPHVTLMGLAEGTHLESVRQLIGEWASTIRPLRLELERATFFPTPAQVVIVQVRKTPELFRALTTLRDRAEQNQLRVLGNIATADWVFHMSVAYCVSLDAVSWAEVSRFAETVDVPRAGCTVREVEIAAFDQGREYSGGTFEFSARTDNTHAI